jgi:hypothetical protein
MRWMETFNHDCYGNSHGLYFYGGVRAGTAQALRGRKNRPIWNNIL